MNRRSIVLFFTCLGLLVNLLSACGESQAPPSKVPGGINTSGPTTLSQVPSIRIHYLGHASFVLQFDSGVSILTDYGQSRAYGLDSPIYDISDFQPTIVTYSHHHPDHDRGATFDTNFILDGLKEITLDGVTIRPVLTSEQTKDDNTSYLITYQGFTILHLGDAQGDISRIDQEEVRQHLKEIFSEPIELMLIPIGWTQNIIQEAEVTVALLQPRQVIPMHYWNPQEKRDFLAHLAAQNEAKGANYQFQEIGDATYDIWIANTDIEPIQVISLEPAPFTP